MDFSSISKILLENLEADTLSKIEYYTTLFHYAFYESDKKLGEPENSDISRAISGQRNVGKEIRHLYLKEGCSQYLKKEVVEILSYAIDSSYVAKQIHGLLWNDSTISDEKKGELSGSYGDKGAFLTCCLLFSFSRPFVAREKRDGGNLPRQDFVLSDFLLDYRLPAMGKVFYGREEELEEIHRRMQEENNLFLMGIGGIGKSELAKQYAKGYKKEYAHVIYLRYAHSLRQTITQLDFAGDSIHLSEEELFQTHYRFFKRLQRDTLVILDNCNILPEEDDLLHEFLSLPFRLLVTTRSKIEGVPLFPVE